MIMKELEPSVFRYRFEHCEEGLSFRKFMKFGEEKLSTIYIVKEMKTCRRNFRDISELFVSAAACAVEN